MNEPKLKACIILTTLLLVAGCVDETPPATTLRAKVDSLSAHMDSLIQHTKSVTEKTPLLILVADLAEYGYTAVPSDELDLWHSNYPTYGSPVNRFLWQIEIETPAGDIPPEYAGNMVANLRAFAAPGYQESFRVRAQCVSASGVDGPWSGWGNWQNKTLTVEVD